MSFDREFFHPASNCCHGDFFYLATEYLGFRFRLAGGFQDLFPRNLDWNLGISFNEFGCLAVFLCRFISKEFIGIGSAVQSFFYGLFLRNVGILIGIFSIVEAKKIFFSISMSIFNSP